MVGDGGDCTRSLTRSLFAVVCHTLQPDFVLHAIPASSTYLGSIAASLCHEADNPLSGCVPAAACVVAHFPQRECDVLLVDRRSDRRVTLVSGLAQYSGVASYRMRASQHLHSTLRTACTLARAGLPAAACVAYVDDRLRELVELAGLLRVYLRERREQRPRISVDSRRLSFTVEMGESVVASVAAAAAAAAALETPALPVAEVARALGVADDDIPLLLSIAAADEPSLRTESKTVWCKERQYLVCVFILARNFYCLVEALSILLLPRGPFLACAVQ